VHRAMDITFFVTSSVLHSLHDSREYMKTATLYCFVMSKNKISVTNTTSVLDV
jgi:hypothetical protein